MRQIKKLRKAAGMTQETLAQSVGVDTSTVAKWETKGFTPRLKTLKQLSKIFNVSIDCLLMGDEDDDA